MKLILRDCLAAMRERDELDAILPDLLSQLGFNVLSRPRRGTRQYGVDFAAVGPDEDGQQKVFLFSIKAGNLTRQDWHLGEQALRPSLEEVIDAYIPTRIPSAYRELDVVVCLCFGGEMREEIQTDVHGFSQRQSRGGLTFRVWNGDFIADLMLKAALREELLPPPLRSSFKKTLAMLEEPDSGLHHFSQLVAGLLDRARPGGKHALMAFRQLYLATWMTFIWARDLDNLEVPYVGSEQALLAGWELIKPHLGKHNAAARAMILVFEQLRILHLTIASSFLQTKILPYANIPHGLSMAVPSHSALDVNLKLFDVLGRLAVTGLWTHWSLTYNGASPNREQVAALQTWTRSTFDFIFNNPTLCLPVTDDQAVEVALVLLLWVSSGIEGEPGWRWMSEIANRLEFALMVNGGYTCVTRDYADLARHPVDGSEAYRQEVTPASTLIPVVASFAYAAGADDVLVVLDRLKNAYLPHCNLQTWLPDASSEEQLYVGSAHHGIGISNLVLSPTGRELVGELIEEEAVPATPLSAMASGYWPIALMGFRRQRLPIPVSLWAHLLRARFAPDDTSPWFEHTSEDLPG